MRTRSVILLLAVMLLFCAGVAFCQTKELPKKQIIAIAEEAVREKGYKVDEAQVIYDEGGRRWCETFGFVGFEDTSPNHGILKRGFLKNYKIVYFDFKEPVKDVWVFVDKDTGEILTIYEER